LISRETDDTNKAASITSKTAAKTGFTSSEKDNSMAKRK